MSEITQRRDKPLKINSLWPICLCISFIVLAGLLVFSHSSLADVIAISRGYSTSQNLPAGTIVTLSAKNQQQVIPANSSDVTGILGVITNSSSSTINIITKNETVQVGISGIYNVNVTDINGPINSGDAITTSPFDGFGMKVSNNVKILGTALASFGSTTKGAKSEQVAGKNGKKITIYVGQIPVLITASNLSVTVNSPSSSSGGGVLSPTQNALSSIANRPVSILKTLAVAIVTLASLLIVLITLVPSVVGGMEAIGRNPLAKHEITQHLIKIILLVLGILIISLAFDSLILFT